ncbi:MAG: calcium/sodium antiporter [Saprospiraceae bacterium]
MTILFLILGLVLLVVGAEALVRGASKIAAGIGISPLIIGLTVVAFGTSSPELAVSIMSSMSGNVDIAVGNVVGSNIFNILFILGLAAIITPLVVAQQLLWVDVPITIGASFLMLIMGLNGQISRVEGLILFIILIAYNIFLIRKSKKERSVLVKLEYETEYGNGTKYDWKFWLINNVLIIIGLALLLLGSRWLVDSATTIARSLGVSDLIIGLTIVAAGTSMPEVATSVIASLRGERDIAVGNAIGSCIFNILAVLGISALVAPGGIPVSAAAIHFDLPIMIASAVACLPIFFTGHRIVRWEGFILFAYYIFYTIYLVLSSAQHSLLQLFDNAILWFVLPLTVMTIIISVVNALRNGNPAIK